MFFKNFKPFLANSALKIQKSANTFSSQNFNMGIKTTQNFKLISKLLRKCKKLANKKVTGKTSVQNWSMSSSTVYYKIVTVFGK
jgi:hypothetical protein